MRVMLHGALQRGQTVTSCDVGHFVLDQSQRCSELAIVGII